MPIRGSTGRRLSFHGLVAITGRDQSERLVASDRITGRERRRSLRLAVFSRLLACMPATRRPNDLFPVSSEAGAPELGMADFTEIRNVPPRPFPKDAGERDCYRYLLGEMQATPDRPDGTKAEIENYCREHFHVTVDSFEYCWREAIKVTGARWDQPGRPPGRKSSR